MNTLPLPKNCKPFVRLDNEEQTLEYTVGLPLGVRQIIANSDYKYSRRLGEYLQATLQENWNLFVDGNYINFSIPFPAEVPYMIFVSVVYIDTATKAFTANDVNRLPSNVFYALEKANWSYSDDLPSLLAPFVSPTFRVMVDGEYASIEEKSTNVEPFTVWLNTETRDIEWNDECVLDEVTAVLNRTGWKFGTTLAMTLAPFVSPNFRLVVNGTDYEPIEVNEKGGKQSTVRGRYDLLPALAIEDIAIVLQEGAIKYGDNNWRSIPASAHVNHALRHCFLWLTTQELDELRHAACRLLMAIEVTYGKG